MINNAFCRLIFKQIAFYATFTNYICSTYFGSFVIKTIFGFSFEKTTFVPQ